MIKAFRNAGTVRSGAAILKGATALLVLAMLAAAVMAPAAQTAPPQAPSAQAGNSAPAAANPYRDALALYQRGRDLEYAGKPAEAKAKYSASLALTEKTLIATPKDMELLVLKCWNLFRLGKHQDVLVTGQAALRNGYDYRIVETMGESSYHLGKNEDALRYFARYAETAPAADERMSTAYFYMGETYLRMKQYEHADIAYATAVYLQPGLPRWWYRFGSALEALGNYKRAWEAYGKALAINPKYAEALAGRDRVKAKTGL
ncbi:MAG: tetratricopeptide repeat protein [Rectinemataceae bacterium]